MAILKVEPNAINSTGDFALGSVSTTGNVTVGGQLIVNNDILPTSANTIDIGSATMRFGKLYLAGNTIDLGGTLISTDAEGQLTFTTDSGNVAITANTISFLSTVANTSSSAGDVAFDGNLNAYAVYTDRYFYANGDVFAGGISSSGATGPTGPTGYTGSRGIQGTQGTTGATGPAGTNGYTGSRGDTGLGFSIVKSYTSVAALTADTSPTGIVTGQFAIIETGDTSNAENSRLYLWNGSAYSYVSDLSGAQGIIGPTGAVGYTGSFGATGATGVAGYTGSIGNAGTNGYTGSQGTGYTGSSGTNGYTGSTGAAGAGYINLSMVGSVTPPFTGTARFYPPSNLTVNTVYANLSSAPTSGNLNFVLKKNGVSIGTTFVLSTALMTPVSVSFSMTTTDYLTMDVSGSAASDLYVKLKYI